ncbi:MAG: fibronectin type III domain-containing protein [Bacteroidota bacterium]
MLRFYTNYLPKQKIFFTILTLLITTIGVFAQAPGTVQLGGATATAIDNSISSPVNNNLFGAADGSRKIQIIYRAAEITALNGVAGLITNLAWDVNEVYSENGIGFLNYTIKMGHTSATSIPTTTFITTTAFTTVRPAADYLPTLGWDVIDFGANDFTWNGTDNILIEVCFDPTLVDYTNLFHGSCSYYTDVADNYRDKGVFDAAACGETDADYTTAIKPRVKLGMQVGTVTCGAPTTLSVTMPGITSTVFTWTAPSTGTPTDYVVEVRASDDITVVTTLTVTSASTVATITTGLAADTDYKAYVRTKCGASFSTYSTVVNFKTLCTSTSVPYTQDFNVTGPPVLPGCTYKQDLNGFETWNTAVTPVGPAQPTGVNSYTGNIIQYSKSTTNPADDWFYTSGLNLTIGQIYRIKYKYGARGTSGKMENMRVCYGTSPVSTSMVTTLSDYPNINAQANLAQIDFTPPSTGAYYFGFYAYSTINRDILYLDDIVIKVKPVCNEVTNTGVYNFTPTTAVLSWTQASPINSTNYVIEVRSSGAAGSGSTGLVSTFTTTNTASSVTLTGMQAATTYTVYIKTLCTEGDISGWNAGINFTTQCDQNPVTALTVYQTTTTSAVASWTNPSVGTTPTVYELEVRESGAVLSGSTGLVSSYSTTHPTNVITFTGLTAATTYTVYIRSKCALGQYSAWESKAFKTLCNAVNVPYNENFSSVVDPNLPLCSQTENLSAAPTNDWSTYNASANNDFATNGGNVLYFGWDGANAANNWFYTQGVNLTAGTVYAVSYKYLGKTTNASFMKVSYGTSPTASAMTTTLANLTSIAGFDGLPNTSGTPATNNFTAPTTGVYYFGFQTNSVANNEYIFLDDISVTTAPLNTNSSLSNLSSSPAGTLAPAFSATTYSYTVTLPFGTTGGATLIPTTAEGTSTTSITSATNVAGSTPANVANVVVTAQNGSTSTYTVTFNLGTANTNSSLATLTTSVGTLSPTFSAGTLNYTVTLPYGTTGGATLTATTAAVTSTRVITNASNVAGTAPANVATVVVTAQNGSTSTYTVTYNVTPVSTDATLMSLIPSTGTLIPVFSPSLTSYTVNMPTGSSGFADLTGVVNSSFASITSNLGALEISSSDPIDNTASITVTAQDGSTMTYYVSFIIGVGINENVANSLSASIYPNPTNGLTTLKVNNTNSSTLKVSVVSVSGQVVSEKEIKTNNQETNYEINLSNQPKGVYFVKIKTNETTLVKRVITY